SVAGDSDTAAMSAEGMRHRGDDADLADSIFKAVTPRCFRARMRNFNQRTVLGHADQNLIQRDDGRWRPGASLFERHEFDEPDRHALFASEHAERNDLVFVES